MKIDTNPQKNKEILKRGVEQIIKKESLIQKLTSGRKLRIKLGIDPTSPTLHLGNAIPLWKLRQFQDIGHQIVLIIGDFTARIGDTSDKMAIRQPLSRERVEENMKNYKEQISKILDLKKTEIMYNSTWLKKVCLEEILRLADQFTVAQILERENFNERYKTGRPINLKEFLYPLMQGYDSVVVKADIEVGGIDQIFNLFAGRTIQKIYGQEPQDIITFTLIEGTDGNKMSKSLGNIIAITSEPIDMFGKIMSIDDSLIMKYFNLCTLLPLEKIKKIESYLDLKKMNPRDVKARLAREIVAMYYNKNIAEKAEKEFNLIFKEKKIPLEIPEIHLKEEEINILYLLVRTKLAPSKSEAKRLILQKGVKINSRIQEDWKKNVKIECGMIVQAGKRKFIKIV